MGLFDLFRRAPPAPAASGTVSPSMGGWVGLDDPRIADFLRDGETQSGGSVGADNALRNMAVFRCVDILSGTIGRLPLYVMQREPSGLLARATEHPLYDVLLHKPNAWQTAEQFRSHMMLNALTEGNGYALVVRSVGRVKQLVPLDPCQVTVRQNDDWTLTYRYNRPQNGWVDYPASDILHIRGLSRDGILGLSRMKVAREAIALALQTEKAAARLFRNGMMVGGAITHPGKLGDAAYNHLKASLQEQYSGAENAHKWLLFEEGMTAKEFGATAANSQQVETRRMQVEEVARAFGVPRPLLMMDDTSWGSGIEQLSILFIQYGLAQWFKAWEGAINCTLLHARERLTLYADFDERELLRGSMADQAAFYRAALGGGGQSPWMTQNEVRDDTGLGRHADGDGLVNPMTAKPGTAAAPAGGANDNAA